MIWSHAFASSMCFRMLPAAASTLYFLSTLCTSASHLHLLTVFIFHNFVAFRVMTSVVVFIFCYLTVPSLSWVRHCACVRISTFFVLHMIRSTAKVKFENSWLTKRMCTWCTTHVSVVYLLRRDDLCICGADTGVPASWMNFDSYIAALANPLHFFYVCSAAILDQSNRSACIHI